MIRRNTIILFAVFLVLLAGIIYINQDTKIQVSLGMLTATPTELPKLISGFSFSNINQIEIQSLDGPNYQIIQDAKGDWYTQKKEQVNLTAIFSVVQYVSTMKLEGIAGPETTLVSVGLSSPATKILLKDPQGTQSVLSIGNPTATQSSYYVKWNDGPISIVSSSEISAILGTFSPDNLLSPTPTPQISSTPILTTLTPTVTK